MKSSYVCIFNFNLWHNFFYIYLIFDLYDLFSQIFLKLKFLISNFMIFVILIIEIIDTSAHIVM